MSYLKSRFKSFSQLIHISQLKPEPTPTRSKKTFPAILTSALISQEAIAKDLDLSRPAENEAEAERVTRSSPFVERLQLRLARDWDKYLVGAAIYGLTAWAWFALTQ